MKALFAFIFGFFCVLPLAFGWQPLVAVHDSEYTRALATMPASGSTPTTSGNTTGFQWWVTNWNYFTIAESVKESFRSDGTAYAVVGDSNIVAGQLMDSDGTPKYPILISLASEAISDQEAADLTNYVAAGGSLFVGSSSFTRETNGTPRGDFAIASAMGLHAANPALTNWGADHTFTTVSDNRIVADIPSGTLFWEMSSSADEVSWPSATHLDGETPDAQMPGLPHLIWQVQAGDATVVATADGNLPYLAVKSFGKGYIIYDAAMEPFLGHGSWAPGMYTYDILRKSIEWAFQSARLPVVRVSPWPYAYDAAVMFRHDMEAIPALVSLIHDSAEFEHTNGGAGDYYFCTGTLRLDMPGASNSVISALQQAVTNFGATIGPHNGGLTNINMYVPSLPVIESPSVMSSLLSEGWLTAYNPYTDPILPPLQSNGFSYDYWHWGLDEILNDTTLPAGFTSGAQYALTSLSNSFSDIAAWQLTNSSPRIWCSPYFNATREPSYQIQQQLNVKIAGDDKLTPFPHWIFSTQTAGKYYSMLSEPVSDWFVGDQVSQSMEYGHTTASIEAMVDFYYNLGALINLYCHTSPVDNALDTPLDYTYETYSLSKPRVWATNGAGIYYWWLQRSNVQVSASFSTNTSPPQTTLSISGSTSTNTAVQFLVPAASFTSLQITTNGVVAGANTYRINGQTIKLQVGNSVTNAVVSYFISPEAEDDVYVDGAGSPLTVGAPGVLANDISGIGQGLSAVLVSGPANGSLSFNSDGSFTYTPTNGYSGMDAFTYEAVSGSLTSSVANVAISVDDPGELAFDNFTRPPGGSIFPWVDEMGTWGITNGVMIGTSPFGAYGYAYYSGGSWTNFSVQAHVQFSSSSGWGGGIGGRMDPETGAHYAAWIYPESSPAGPGNGKAVLQMLKYRDWLDYTNMGTFLTLPGVGTGTHTVQLTFQSNTIAVFFDGSLLTNITDNGVSIDGRPAYTSGTIGLNMWTESPVAYTMAVDNVIVTTLATVANNDAYTTKTNTTLNVSAPGVLGNDSGGNGPLTALLTTGPAHGTLTLTNNGGFQYTPAHNFAGTDSFTYQATDGQTTSSVATVTIAVNNNTIVVNPDNYTLADNSTFNVSGPGVLANDTGGIGPLTAILASGPSKGTLTLTNNGGFSYTPTTGFIGIDSFTYQATDGSTTSSVTAVTLNVKDPPVANNEIFVTTPGALLNVAAPGILAADNDTNSLSAILETNPLFGAFSLGSDGSFSYQSTNNFAGVDDFSYEDTDGQNTSSVATVAVEVVPPGKLFLDDFTHAPLWPWVQESGTWTIGNDIMSGANPFESYGHVYLTNNWADYLVQAQIRFTDINGWGGGIGGRLNDPVTGTHYAAWVYPEGSAFGGPKLLLEKYASWTDVGWQILAQTALSSVGTNWNTLGLAFQGTNLFVYYNGTEIIATNDNSTYNGGPYTNGGVCANMWEESPVAYTMSVSNVTVAALVANAGYSTSAGTTLSVGAPGPLGNDTPVYGGALSMTGVSAPAHGTLTFTNNGGFAYTPTNNYVGMDSFTYQATDGAFVLGTGTITIAVNPVHNGPTLPNQPNLTNAELVTLTVTNTATDTDVPLTTLTYTLTGPMNAEISTNGIITWTPGFSQAPSTNLFTTIVTDAGNPPLSATNTFTVTVITVNQAPTLSLATNNVVTLANGGGVTLSNFASAVPGPANESSQSITNFAILSISNAQMFAVSPSIDTNGTLTFTSANTSNGVVSVTVQAQDNGGTANGGTNGSVAQTFTITVLSVAQPPVLTLASNNVTRLENAGAVNVPNFASAVPGQAGLSVTNFAILSVSNAQMFAVAPTISVGGTLSFTSANTSNGVASVTVQAQDTGSAANGGTNGSAAQTFTITVLSVAQPPILTLASNNVTSLENAGAVSTPNFASAVPGQAGLSVTNFAILSVSNAQMFAVIPTISVGGTLSFTTANTSNGVASVTVQAQDTGSAANGGTNGSVAQTFTITVLSVAQPPVLTLASNNVTSLENAGAVSTPSFASAVPGQAGLSVTNFAILSVSNAQMFATGPVISVGGTLSFTSANTSNGVASVTVQAQDTGSAANGGTNGSAAQTFTVTVLSVAQPPILTLASNNVTSLENAGAVNVPNFASAVPGQAGLSVTNFAILSVSNAQMFAVAPTISVSGTLTYTTVTTSNGVASVTVQAQDTGSAANGGTNGSAAQTFTVTVLSVAQPPVLTLASNNVTSLENAGAVSVTSFASATPGQAGLSVTNFAILSISNAQMFALSPSIDTNGTLTFTSANTSNGVASVTVQAQDTGSAANGGTNGSVAQTFTITVLSVAQPPILTLASNNVTSLENAGAVSVTSFASATPGQAGLSVTNFAILSISNAQMFAVAPTISVSGTLTYTTVTTSNGVASVTVQAQDTGSAANGGTNGSAAQTFTVTVLSVAQPPILTLVSNNVTSLENAGAVSVTSFASATPGQAGLSVTNFAILSISNAQMFAAAPAISTSGTLSFTSANTSNGVASVTVQAQDTGSPANGGTNGSVAQTFTITVLSVAQPPVLTLASNNVTSLENAGAVSVPSFASAVPGQAGLSVTNFAILSVSNAQMFAAAPAISTSGTLSFTSANTSNGVASVTVQAQDTGSAANGGTNGSVAQTFTITVLSVAQPPVLTLASNNVTRLENAGAVSVTSFASATPGQAGLSVTNFAILSISNAQMFAVAPAISVGGTLSFTSANTSNGVASVTVQAQDTGSAANGGTNGSVAQTFTITVLSVAQPPVLTLASNNVISLENAGAVSVTSFASATPGQAGLSVTNFAILSVSNAQMFAVAPTISVSGTLTYTTVTTSNGVASVTVQAQDTGSAANGGTNGSVAQTFTITVLSVAQPPVLTLASNNVTSLENAGAVSVTSFASATPGQAGLSVTNFAILSISNAQMFAVAPAISVGGTLSFTSANTSNGVASVTVQAQDTGSAANGGTNGSVAQTFTITVLSVAQPPVLTLASNNVTSLENAGAVSVPSFASAVPGQAGLSVTNFAILSVSNAQMFAEAPTISVSGTLTYTTVTTSNGVASVTVQAQDTGSAANGGTNGSVAQTFTITVLSVAQPPVLTLASNNVTRLENAGAVSVTSFASATPGQAGLSVTNFAILSISNAQMFAVAPAISVGGTLSFTSANTSNGVASVTVQAQDTGSAANGGTNGSVAQTFTITVLSVAQPPVLTLASNNVISLENAGAVSVTSFASATPGQAGLSVTNFAILSVSNAQMFAVAPTISVGGTLSFTTANTSNGVASVTVQAQDTGSAANGGTNGSVAQTFTITVLSVAQPPVLTLASNNVTSLENAGAVSVTSFASATPGQAGLSVTNFAILSISNAQMFAVAPAISVGGTLSFTSANTSNGVASVTVQAQDTGSAANGGTNGSAAQTFTVTVLSVAQPPILTLASNNVTSLENAGAVSVTSFVSATPGQAGLNVTNFAILSISNAQMFATGPVISPSGTLSFTSANTSNGVASVTVQAQDTGSAANGGTNGSVAQTFTITVLSVAQPPVLTLASNNVTSLENAGAVNTPSFASATPGQAGLTVTNFAILSISNAQMFAVAPTISVGGTLSFTSANTSNGVASVTVQAQDTGSAANGGTNGSVAQTFTITVLSVAQPPVLTLASNNVTSLENAGAVNTPSFASATPGQAGLTVTNFAILSISNAQMFAVAPTISVGGTLSFTSANTSNGVASVTVQAQDTGSAANGGTNGSAAQTFTVTVLSVAQPPILTLASNNVTSLENAGAVSTPSFASATPGQAGLTVTNFAILSVSNAQMFAVAPTISVSGTLTYTTVTTSNGVASVTVQAQDTGSAANGGTNGSAAQTFTVTVLSVAQPPILTLVSNNVTSLENAGAVSVTSFASATPGQAGLSVTNFAILSISNAQMFALSPSIDTNGTLTFTSANTSNGVASVTVQAQDTGSAANGGTNGSVAQTFTITVLSVAQPPVLTLASNNVISLENAGAVSVPSFASAVPGQAGLSVTNFAILSVSNAQMFAAAPAISTSGTLSFTSANTSNGVASVTVQAQDTGSAANGGTNGSVAQTFTITVLSVAQPPVLTLASNNVTSLENAGAVSVTSFASATPGQAGLSVTNFAILSISNAQMFALSPSIDTNGTLTFTSANTSNGVASVTVQAQDTGSAANGGTNGSVAQTFTITVLSVAQPPILTLASNNVTSLENAGAVSTPSFASAVPGQAGLSVTNFAILSISNAQMFAVAPTISVGGTLTYTTVTTSNGVASVTVQAQDTGSPANGGTNGSVAQTFTITVLSVAQPPVLTLASNNVTSLENAGAVSVPSFASAVPGQAGLSVTNFAILSVSNAQMFAAAPAISTSGTLSFTSANTSNGVASVTVQAQDTGSAANGGTNGSVAQTFTITVLSVAQPPVLTLASNNVTSLENAGAVNTPSFASAVPGQAGLSVTNFAILSISNAQMFAAAPAISTSGTLSFTSANTSNGVASVTVQAQDTGSPANGGTNGSVAQTFTITVLSVAQPPVLTLASNNVTSLENAGAVSVPSFASAVPGQAGLSVTNFAILSVSNAQMFAAAPAISTSGTLSFTSANTSNGVASVTVQAQDTGSAANGGTNGSVAQTFTITVLSVAQPPVLTLASNNVTRLENAGAVSVTSFASATPGQAGLSVTNFAILSISNAQMFAVAPAISVGGTLSFTSANTSNGVASVTVQAQDTGSAANGGTNGSVAQTFTITVLSVAQPPVLTLASNNVISLENAGAVSVTSFASATPGQAGLSVTNFAILSVSNAQMFAVAPTISVSGTLTYTTVTTSNGVASVTVQAQDTGSAANGGTNGSVAQTFTITVLSVAQPPVLTLASNNVTSLENAGAVSVTSFASATPGQAGLSVTNFAILSISNAQMFAVAPAISVGGTLSFTSANTSNGVASVTVQAQDTGSAANGGTNGSVAQTFTITVLSVAQPPVLTLASNNVISLENAGAVSVTSFASATPGQAGLSVTNFAILSVSNAQMFAVAPTISVSGTLTYTTVTTSNGVASVTVQAQDTGSAANGGTNGSVAQTFTITVLSVAQPPILTLASNNVTSLENAGAVSVPSFASAVPGQAGLTVTNFAILSVSNAQMFAVIPTISVSGTLTYTTVTTSNGVASVTVQAQDTGSAANGGTNGSVAQTFTITVLPVNQPPTLNLASNNVITVENAGQIIMFGFAAITTGPANEAGQSITNVALLSISNATLFASGPLMTLNGALIFTLAANSSGVASVTVQAQDNGGTANGGTNGSVAQTFTITVLPVDHPPVLPAQPNRVIGVSTLMMVTNTATDPDLPAQTLTYALTGPAGAMISTNGVISWMPTALQAPSTNVFTTVVTDNGQPPLSATNSFTVVVTNAAPLFEITSIKVSNGVATITWNSTAGTIYRLMFKNALTNSNWTEIPINVQASGSSTSTTNSIAGVGARFYLVEQVTEQQGASLTLPAQGSEVLEVLTPLVVTNTATDNNDLATTVNYTLTGPTNAAIDANGVITWTPTAAQAPGTNVFTTIATDNGVPPLSATNSFAVTVTNIKITSIATSNSVATVTWSSMATHVYRLQYNGDLTTEDWSNVAPDVTATGSSASTTNFFGGTPHLFYRVFRVSP